MPDLCECGRFRGSGKHECWFVTEADYTRAYQRQEQDRLISQGIVRAPEVRYEAKIWLAWRQAIQEDAQREVEQLCPADNLT